MEIKHHKDNSKFVLIVNGKEAKVDCILKEENMYLVHSEVSYYLRGKELVFKTFEKLIEKGYKALAVCSCVRMVKERSEKWKFIIE